MYIAGYIVTGFVLAGAVRVRAAARALGPLRADRVGDPADDRRARRAVQVLVGDWAARDVATTQPIKLAAIEGLYKTTSGRARAPARLVHRRPGQVRDRDPAAAVAARLPRPEREGAGLDTVPPSQRPPVNVVRIAFQTMVGIGTLLALLGVVSLVVRLRRKRLPESLWFYRALVAAGAAGGRRADRRLGRDRGRAPAVGRLSA